MFGNGVLIGMMPTTMLTVQNAIRRGPLQGLLMFAAVVSGDRTPDTAVQRAAATMVPIPGLTTWVSACSQYQIDLLKRVKGNTRKRCSPA